MKGNDFPKSDKVGLLLAHIRRLVLSVLFLAVVLQPAHAERKQKILVLHSYHQGLEWADNINRGIQQVFGKHQGAYEIYYEYLDTKRNADNGYLDKVASFINLKNENVQYELIITVDNTALYMLNTGKIRFSGDPPVVFAGVNNYKPELTSNLRRVTGVVETTDHVGTIDLMRKLHPDSHNITVVIDQTPTGKLIRGEMRAVEQVYSGEINFHYLSNFLLSDIPDIVRSLEKDELLYILTFNRDSENNFISYGEGIEMIARHTDAPIYGSWDFYLGKGIVGGKITSGLLQGKTVADLALRVLTGEDIRNIEILKRSPTRFMFDHNYVEKHHINESLLPSSAVIINKPLSLFEEHKTLLLNLFVVLFISVLAVLYIYKRKQSKLQGEYAASLEVKVQKRTEKLREANEKLQRLSNIDGLSQLYNRRYFDLVLTQELQRHQRSADPLTLMMCDIDYFKNYNDSYGHIAGDDCIKRVASLLKANCKRANDTVARYGGEEFAVILPVTDCANAKIVAARICDALMKEAIPHKSSGVSTVVTISIGVAVVLPNQGTSMLDIIALADKALYTSKSQGRNRFTVVQVPPDTTHMD